MHGHCRQPRDEDGPVVDHGVGDEPGAGQCTTFGSLPERSASWEADRNEIRI